MDTTPSTMTLMSLRSFSVRLPHTMLLLTAGSSDCGMQQWLTYHLALSGSRDFKVSKFLI